MKRDSPLTAILCACGAALAGAPAAASAQTYPDKPIRFIVPSPPGGGTDALTRLIANKLGADLQWKMIVDNRPGAGGNLGLDAAAKAQADGYTIVMGESSNLTINQSLYASLPFDPVKDFAPITLIGTVPLVLVVAPGRALDSLPALIAASKSKPLTFASSGNGTVGHLAAELWKRSAGVELLHVPYKGAGPAVTDLMGGQVDLHFGSAPAVAPLVAGAKLRALAVTSAQRTELLPEVPTLIELGYRDFDCRVLYGVLAPAGTASAITARLNAEINHALQTADLRASFAKLGVETRGGTPAQFDTYLKGERTKWARAVKESGAKVD